MSGVPLLDLSTPRRIHVLNVGGAGMSAIATLLAEMGHQVSGSDPTETPFLDPLRRLGVDVVIERPAVAVALPGAVDAVVTSTATPAEHAVVAAARAAAVPVVHRGDALAAICALRRVLAVAGTHGKSTTSGMLATITEETGSGFLVGTRVTGLGTNAGWRTGPDLVVEADESDGTFLRVGAHHAVVTNLEADHLSHWGTEEALVHGFRRFVADLPGTAVLCLDDPGAAALVPHAARTVTYGTDPAADLVIADVAPAGIGVSFTLTRAGRSVAVTVPSAPGLHNARNAAGALALAELAGVPLEDGAASLASFAGVARRFEVRGEAGGVTFVDSYDHLPTEVAAALAAARTGPFRRVVCAFQPHRYTRTRDLWRTFADCFGDAHVLGVCGIYPAGEAPTPGVTGKLVLDAVLEAHPHREAAWLPDLAAAESWLLATLRPGDLCLTLNAGDLTRLPDRLIERLGAPRPGDAR